MPQITTIEYPLSQIVDAFDAPQDRKPGWHVTDLIRAAEDISKGKQVPNGGFPFDGDTSGMMSLGRMWEGVVREWLSSYALKMNMVAVFSEAIEEQEIIANLDGRVRELQAFTSQTPMNIAILEMKATTTADSNPLTKPKWISQVKAYCHMVGVNQVWFVVLHLPRRGAPTAKVYLHIVGFEDWEIEENWNMLISTKEYLEGKGVRLWRV